MNRRLLITILIALLLITGTVVAIYFAKGYRVDLKKGKVTENGLLVANSFPTGASVFLNNKLTTATNDTLQLTPGDYEVKIVKDGYIAWQKFLKLKKELVTQTDARLFPAVPDLKSLTTSGASNLTPSPDGEKIAFVVASASATAKNGLWILDLGNKSLTMSKDPKQITANTVFFDLTKALLIWSPDSKQILAWNGKNSFVLETDKINNLNLQDDVSVRLSLILKEWEDEWELKFGEKMKKLAPKMQEIMANSSTNIYFSPDEEKMMYTATASATIPNELIPPLPASNTQSEIRMIEPGKIYVYDLKEDKNFILNEVQTLTEVKEKKTVLEQRLMALQKKYFSLLTQTVQWFPDSKHVVLVKENKIIIAEYDATNQATIYAGLFNDAFTYPWPDGSRLIILTTLNPEPSLPSNLYAIELK